MELPVSESTPLVSANNALLWGTYSVGYSSGYSTSSNNNSTAAAAVKHGDDNDHVQNEDGDFVVLDVDDKNHETTRRYKATQFISFTINTIGGLAKHGECEGRSVDPTNGVCYLGNDKNVTEDVRHRFEIVKRVLMKIKEDYFKVSPDIDHANDVLKIFMMPEFYWRGPHGAYSIKDLTNEHGILTEIGREMLGDIIQEDYFQDFLFVFGTIIATNDNHGNDAKDIQYYNFAQVALGGSGHKHYFTVTKKYISGADFLSRTSLPNPTLAMMHDYAEMDKHIQDEIEARNFTLITNNLVDLDGLRIGIEICLDHRLGTLWNDLRLKHNGELVDVLLVTSAGMAIERGPNPIVRGGVVYLSDGEASSAACLRTDHLDRFLPDRVCRGDVGGLKHIPTGGDGYSSFFALTACWDLEDIDLLKGYYSMYQTQGCAYTLKTYDINVMDEFQYYPPSIEIYPTVSLPENAYKRN